MENENHLVKVEGLNTSFLQQAYLICKSAPKITISFITFISQKTMIVKYEKNKYLLRFSS